VAPNPDAWLRWTWRRAPPTRASGFSRAGRWLVLADRQGLADGVERALSEAGAQVVRVEAATPEEPARGWHRVDPADPAGVLAMLEKVAPRGLRGVVFLWGLDRPDGWRAACCVADALAVVRTPAMPRLYLGTREAQGCVAGLSDAFVTRWPRQRCTWLDVADARAPEEVAGVVRELLADTDESRVRFRGGERHVGRLVRVAPVPRGDAGLVATSDFALRREGDGWVPVAHSRRVPEQGEVEVAVEAVAVGEELVGVAGVANGEAVFCVAPGAPASHVTLAATAVVPRGALGTAEAAQSALRYVSAVGADPPALLRAVAAGALPPVPATAVSYRSRGEGAVTLLDGPPVAVIAPGVSLGGVWRVTGSSAACVDAGVAALVALGATIGEDGRCLHVEGSRVRPEDLDARLAAVTAVRGVVCTAFAAAPYAGDPVGAALAAFVDTLPDVTALHWGRTGVDLDALPAPEAAAVVATMLRSLAAPGHWIEDADTVLAARAATPAFAELFPAPERAVSTLATDLLALSPADAELRLAARVSEHLGTILRSDAPVDLDAPVATLGVDSLSALELVNRLDAEIGVRLPTRTLLEPHTVRSLSSEVLRRLLEKEA
jgi:acyl carrier protein